YDSAAIQDLGTVDEADDTACEIVFAGMIQARQLCRLTANQGAATLFARLSKTGNQLIEHGRIQPFRADVIEEKQRPRAGDCDVVNAMIDKVLGNIRMPSECNCDFSFVPTPSMLDTSTGSFIPLKFALNRPPNPPILPRTSGPNVERTFS